ncbi:MAG: hypothetical protein JWQ24_2097 [Tardiphaga sp.]|nr:hypothetical protein [Tardiphaga sp.]
MSFLRCLEPAIADGRLVTRDLHLDELGAGQTLVSGERRKLVAKVGRVQGNDQRDAVAPTDPFGTEAKSRGWVAEFLVGRRQDPEEVARDSRVRRRHTRALAQPLDRRTKRREGARRQ